MSSLTPDEILIKLINTTLCIDTEICMTKEFIEFETIYARENGHETQLEILTTFKPMFNQLIDSEFNSKVYDAILHSDSDKMPDAMDYLMAYANLTKKFWSNFAAANKVLRKHFKDTYRLESLNLLIEQSYPGIEHNPELFPHQEFHTIFNK